jgi:hypothetical protein
MWGILISNARTQLCYTDSNRLFNNPLDLLHFRRHCRRWPRIGGQPSIRCSNTPRLGSVLVRFHSEKSRMNRTKHLLVIFIHI